MFLSILWLILLNSPMSSQEEQPLVEAENQEVVPEKTLGKASGKQSGERNWYVIHTYSGYEDQVAQNLRQRIESLGMQEQIFDVMVPIEKQIEIKNGSTICTIFLWAIVPRWSVFICIRPLHECYICHIGIYEQMTYIFVYRRLDGLISFDYFLLVCEDEGIRLQVMVKPYTVMLITELFPECCDLIMYMGYFFFTKLI